MSAPSRGAGARRARSTTPPTNRARGSRGVSRPFQPRGRGRGVTDGTPNPRAEGLLQGLQAGNLNKRGTDNGAVRGIRGNVGSSLQICHPLTDSGRGTAIRGNSTSERGQSSNNSKTFSTPKARPATPKASAALTSQSDYMVQATTRFETLKRNRESERARAIKDGFLADPDKKTTLDNAITPVGTCTEMCPAFERVERVVQRAIDKSEKAPDDSTRPDEQRMVKRFRRSAAGYDEQLPSDIRTPATLKMTLDYLLDDIIGGGERLATIHKFVWDRTRGIRNDFSIQQVTKKEDVTVAVQCLERIARFHILSLHQLSNPENLVGEQFDAHQDREQLNNTLLSLMYYYDDNRHVLNFPNEAEFRAYCIIFELQSQHPDLEDRMQSWPKALLEDGRIKTAFRLYAAAGNVTFDQGPLRPLTPFSLAQGNTGSFWSILSSKQVSYLMACVAEIYFGQVRFMTLQALWTAATSAPVGTRGKNQDWTLMELANVLGFDTEGQVAEFCEEFGLNFSTKDDGTQYLDVSLTRTLDKSSVPNKQVFSYGIVETKRFRRTLTAVINGKTVPQAVREGLVVAEEEQAEEEEPVDDGQSLFLPEKKPASANPFAKANEQVSANPFTAATSLGFNPQQAAFTPGTGIFQQSQSVPVSQSETFVNPFAKASSPFTGGLQLEESSANPFAKATSAFPSMGPPKVDSPTTAAKTANPFSRPFGFSFTPQSTPPKPTSQPFVFGGGIQPTPPHPTAQPFVFGGGLDTIATSSPVNAPPTISAPPFSFFTSQPISTSTTTQPPTFSFPGPREENTQSTGPSGSTPEFSPARPNPYDGPAMPQLTLPPGTVTGQKEAQPAPPKPKNAQPPPPKERPSPQQVLQRARSNSPLKFSTETNGSTATSTAPTITFPRQSPRENSPLAGRLPGDALIQDRNTVVLPSIEVDPAGTQNAPVTQTRSNNTTNPPAGQAGNPIRLDPDDSGSFTRPTSGYQWSDPTVPGYSNRTARAAPPPRPQKPPVSPAQKQKIVDALAHVAMRQGSGSLMVEFTKFAVPDIIKSAIDQHLREVYDEESRVIREDYLLRKYVKLLEKAYWSRKIQRRAVQRRAAFIEIDRECIEQERRRSQNSAEIDEIRTEVESSARIKAEVAANLKKDEEERMRKEREAELMTPEPSQIAGRKRKSDASENVEPRRDLAGRLYVPSHKRSRTMTSYDEDDGSNEGHGLSPVRGHGATHRSAARSLFSGRASGYGTQLASQPPPPPIRSIDRTYTDYFRSKARGLDPDSPMVGLSAKQVEHRRQQAEAEKARFAAEPPPRKRRSGLTPPSHSRPADIRKTKTNEHKVLASSKQSPRITKPPQKPKPKSDSDSIDDLLRRLKQFKENQEADTEWFKTEREALEQEDDLREQTVMLHQTVERRDSSQTNSSGLIKSQLGYEFVAAAPKPGSTLSRTEQRIRRTGAQGLATAPIGGIPGYVKPTMSSLERNLRDSLNGTGQGEVADANETNGAQPQGGDDFFEEDVAEGTDIMATYSNGKGKERAVDTSTSDITDTAIGYRDHHSANSFGTLDFDELEENMQQRIASEEAVGDEYSDLEDEDEDGYGEDGDELDEDDIASEEGDYEDDDDEEQAGPSSRGQFLSAAPSRGASSGAQSGAGATPDDAIDLDSD